MSSRVGKGVGAAVVVFFPTQELLVPLDVLGEDPLFFFLRAEYPVPSPRCRRRRVMRRPRRRSGKEEDATLSMSIVMVVVGAMVGAVLLLPANPLPLEPLPLAEGMERERLSFPEEKVAKVEVDDEDFGRMVDLDPLRLFLPPSPEVERGVGSKEATSVVPPVGSDVMVETAAAVWLPRVMPTAARR